FQVLRGRRHYFDPGVAGVALLATDLDPLDVELDPQVHELVEDLREDHGVDDVSADLDDLGIPLFQRHDSPDATITPSNNDRGCAPERRNRSFPAIDRNIYIPQILTKAGAIWQRRTRTAPAASGRFVVHADGRVL